MLIGYFVPYRQIVGTIEFTDGKHHGYLLDVNGFVNYTAGSVEQLYKKFQKSVDDYLLIKEEGLVKGEING